MNQYNKTNTNTTNHLHSKKVLTAKNAAPKRLNFGSITSVPKEELLTYADTTQFLIEAVPQLKAKYVQFLSERVFFGEAEAQTEYDEWGFNAKDLSAQAFIFETVNAFIWDENHMSDVRRTMNRKKKAA
jgi:hypothetical protein